MNYCLTLKHIIAKGESITIKVKGLVICVIRINYFIQWSQGAYVSR